MDTIAECYDSKLEPATLGNLIKHDKHYIIPDYQRGYRWDKRQVKALLRDILEFYNGAYRRSVDECYCLQPIVLCPADGAYEVIDGQQRLITLLIIFKALGSNCYDIEFAQRPKSTEYLHELTDGLNPEEGDTNPDFHFMKQTHKIVAEWVKRQAELDDDDNFCESTKSMLKTRVKVIRYEVALPDVKSKIEIFNRLNIGKIELNDAELIKAWLLNYCKADDTPEREKLLRQSEMARLWDEMELSMRNKKVLGYLNVSTEDDEHLQASNLLYIFRKIADQSETSDYTTFLAVEKRVTDIAATAEPKQQLEAARHEAMRVWDEARQWFATLMSWIDDPDLYHYIGYILATRIDTVDSLIKTMNEERMGKQGFKEHLKSLIRKDMAKYDIDKFDYETTRDSDIHRVLLLFNVLSAMEFPDLSARRFPFHRYNNPGSRWTLEHIYAQQSQDPLKNEAYIQQYITDTLAQLDTIPTLDFAGANDGTDERHQAYTEIIATLRQLKGRKLSPEDIETFNNARRRLLNLFDIASPSVHPLDNLALIRQSENSALSNNIFPVKRAKILKYLKEGQRYVPQCTVNVFTKIYSAPGTRIYEWSAKDRENYLEEIKRVLSII